MGYESAPLAIETREHPAPKTLRFLGVAGGTIERSCYSPHYVNTERDHERDHERDYQVS